MKLPQVNPPEAGLPAGSNKQKAKIPIPLAPHRKRYLREARFLPRFDPEGSGSPLRSDKLRGISEF